MERSAFLLLIILIHYSTCVSSTPSKVKEVKESALVISGGISLGNYEAGLNYIIAEFSGTKLHTANLPELKVITGSSAGAINALATAIHTCLKPEERKNGLFNNIFRDIWIDVDLENLLPKEFSTYQNLFLGGVEPYGKASEIPDGVFSRHPFSSVIENMRILVDTKEFRDDCNLIVGVMVTKPNPEKVNLQLSNGTIKEIDTQSFAIPIRVFKQKGKQGLTFAPVSTEELREVNLRGKTRRYINLPSKDNEISFESIIRAVLASSAFPAAFGPVRLGYCHNNLKEQPTSSDKYCAKEEKYETGMFIDGGYFNNVPIGLAAELMSLDSDKALKKNQNFYYLDPDNIKRPQIQLQNRNKNDSLTISAQLNRLLSGLNTLRKQDTYSDLQTYFVNNESNIKRDYVPTQRSPRLTGNYLGAFGAFFDSTFREYDYAAGIYDGLRLISKRMCNGVVDAVKLRCERLRFEENVEKILRIGPVADGQKIADFKALLGAFICDEFGTYTINGSRCIGINEGWSNIVQKYFSANYHSASYAIYKSLNHKTATDFKAFLEQLKKESQSLQNTSEIEFNAQLNYMLARPEYWEGLLLQRLLNRLVYLEEVSNGDLRQHLATARLFVPKDHYASYNIGNARDPRLFNWKYSIIPDLFGVDAVQTGIVVGWTYVPNIDHILPWKSNLELGFSYHHQIKDNSADKVTFISGAAGLRWNRPQTFWSSYGFAINVNSNVSNTSVYGKSPMVGIEGNMSFLSDKVRLSIGTRDMISNYEGEDWSVRLTFTNIDELVWAFW